MIMNKQHAICVTWITCLLATALAAPPPAVDLNDVHFLITPSKTNVLAHLIIRDLQSNSVAMSQVSTQVSERITSDADIIMPYMDFPRNAVSNSLPLAADYPNRYISPTGTVEDGTLYMYYPNASPTNPWVPVLSIKTNMLSCMTTKETAYLEYIDRLAQFLELQVGVLTNGELIFGTAGNWPTNYTPAYTIELDVRYGQ